MKTLLIDIETSPNIGYYFELWKEGNIVETIRDWSILCFAYKWLGDNKVTVISNKNTTSKNYDNDRQICSKLVDVLNEADVVIAHNGDSFDIKKINARLIFHGFTPPSPYKTIDTKKVAKKYFKFDSNKLNDLGKYLGCGEKSDTGGFQTWIGCMNGDSKSWDKMEEYNIQDVVLLEKIYIILRPWITTHPNSNLYTGETLCCPKCGSSKTQKRGKLVTLLGTYERYHCQSCGGWSKGGLVKREDKPIK